jgi:hypothetical protein
MRLLYVTLEKMSYTKPELRERIKSRVMAGSDGGKPGQWSARKAQLVAQKYEEAGGGYKGGKTEAQKSLSKWTDQKWTTSDGKPAERKGGTTRYLPEKAWDKLSPRERAATNAKKREGSRKGEQFVANTEAAAEARKEAMYQQAPFEIERYAQIKRAAQQNTLRQFGFGETKTASPLLHGLGMTLAGHIGTNAMGRAAHHHSNIGEYLAHLGLKHALSSNNSRITPSRLQSIKMLFGPEAMMTYEATHQLGKQISKKINNPALRQLALATALPQPSGPLANAPVLSEMHKALRHEVAGTAPKIQAKGRVSGAYANLMKWLTNHTTSDNQTKTQKVIGAITGAAPLAPVIAIDAALSGGVPLGAIGHLGWNLTRQVAANTDIGKRVVQNEIQKGLRGERLSRPAEYIIDHLISPAFLDARRAALAAHETNPTAARYLADNQHLLRPEALYQNAPAIMAALQQEGVPEKAKAFMAKANIAPEKAKAFMAKANIDPEKAKALLSNAYADPMKVLQGLKPAPTNESSKLSPRAKKLIAAGIAAPVTAYGGYKLRQHLSQDAEEHP